MPEKEQANLAFLQVRKKLPLKKKMFSKVIQG